MPTKKAAKEFQIPKQPAAAADLLYKLREQRYELQRQAAEIEEAEKKLKDYFRLTLPKDSATGIMGRTAKVELKKKVVPRVADWPKFYAYVKSKNRFDLMQRRVSESAVAEMWEDGKAVPGVEPFVDYSVSVTKK